MDIDKNKILARIMQINEQVNQNNAVIQQTLAQNNSCIGARTELQNLLDRLDAEDAENESKETVDPMEH
jgi:hypothetical protein